MARQHYMLAISMSLLAASLRSGETWKDTPLVTEQPMAIDSNGGIITKPSSHTVDQTVDKLRALLQAKGITLFALVDHSGEAAKLGMRMPPTKLLIFGSPRAGTPLMLAAPSIALDLPLKILVSEDSRGKVWLSYNAPGFLAERHHLPHDLVPVLGAVEAFVTAAAN
jgi:uncharacterized protein (DUF302 family)